MVNGNAGEGKKSQKTQKFNRLSGKNIKEIGEILSSQDKASLENKVKLLTNAGGRRFNIRVLNRILSKANLESGFKSFSELLLNKSKDIFDSIPSDVLKKTIIEKAFNELIYNDRYRNDANTTPFDDTKKFGIDEVRDVLHTISTIEGSTSEHLKLKPRLFDKKIAILEKSLPKVEEGGNVEEVSTLNNGKISDTKQHEQLLLNSKFNPKLGSSEKILLGLDKACGFFKKGVYRLKLINQDRRNQNVQKYEQVLKEIEALKKGNGELTET